jgi:hypothetical protein
LLSTITCAVVSYLMLELFRKFDVCQFMRESPRDIYEVVAFHRTPGDSVSRSVSQYFTKTRLSVYNSA